MNIDALRTVVKNEPPKHLIEELAPESPTLKEMNEAFMEIAKDIDILTCYETESTRTLAWDVGDKQPENLKSCRNRKLTGSIGIQEHLDALRRTDSDVTPILCHTVLAQRKSHSCQCESFDHC